MRKVFKNDDLDAILEENGFTIQPLLSAEEIEKCKVVYQKYYPNTEAGKYNTLEINDSAHRANISNDLRSILENRIGEVVDNYRFIGVNFAVKKAGSDEEFPMHIDDDHCDRSKFKGLNVWVPLIDVNKNNGGLYIVPKSHRLPYTVNGIGAPFAYEEHRDLFLEHAYFVEMKAGEGLFFDARMIHGSFDNPTGDQRIAMISGMIPREADFIMYINYKGLEHQQLELFEVDEDILLNLEIGKRPEGYKSHGFFKQENPVISREEILQTIG